MSDRLHRLAAILAMAGIGCTSMFAARAVMEDYSIGSDSAAVEQDSFGFTPGTNYNTAVITFTGLTNPNALNIQQIRLSNSPTFSAGNPRDNGVRFLPGVGTAIQSKQCIGSGSTWTCYFDTFSFPANNATPIYPYVTQGSGVINAGSTIDVQLSLTDGPPPNNGGLGLRFIPVSPCRVVDTRPGQAPQGSFGPPSLPANGSRDFQIPLGRCSIPTAAQAYSLNVTAVPKGPLGFISVWPTGQARPTVSTLNSYNGQVVANAAVVPAGSNGSISVYATDATDVVIDINGYFAPTSYVPQVGTSLVFHPVNPCRIVDTRPGQNTSGLFGPPTMQANSQRDFPFVGSCGLPASAQAYSVNITVAPQGPLGFLTAWPTGQQRPFVSTLNAPQGLVTANAAIVPAGGNGGVSIYVTDATDVIVDVNGYFSAPDGGANNLLLYTVNPCRVADTRTGQGTTGAFGPPSLPANGSRSVPIPSGGCPGIPATAQAYSLNATVVPPSSFGYLTLWPAGRTQPFVSTLNSPDGSVRANAAIVPAGTNGAVNVFASSPTDFLLDINGYFAPPTN